MNARLLVAVPPAKAAVPLSAKLGRGLKSGFLSSLAASLLLHRHKIGDWAFREPAPPRGECSYQLFGLARLERRKGTAALLMFRFAPREVEVFRTAWPTRPNSLRHGSSLSFRAG